jgi:hypothetical protein
MSLIRRKKVNRRKPAPRKRVNGAAVLRAIPRPRMPRGRSAAVAAAALALLGLLAWQGGSAYMRGSWLTVTRLEVEGNRHWSEGRLLEAAGVDVGSRLHEIPFRAARARLDAFPGIESASVRYLPGGALRVAVREAEPVAARRFASGWRGLTPGAEWIPLTADAALEVPMLETRDGSPRALRLAASWLAGVRARQPDLYAGFSQVALRGGAGEADVYWRDGNVRLRVDCARPGSMEHAGELMRREESVWPEGATVDLRVEGYAYVR